MSMRNGFFLGAVLVLTLSQACGDPVGPSRSAPITSLPRALSLTEEIVIDRANTFGFDLLKELDAERTGDRTNTVISPLSASMALGMALEGADGENFTEMRETLGFEGQARADINASYSGLLELLTNLDPAVEIGIANSAWSRQEFPFHQSYFDALTASFKARVQELDFEDPGSKGIINHWVNEQTNGRIKEIIDEIDPSDILFLINAVYFKGDWTTQFKKSDTHQADFSLDGATTVSVPMMSGEIEDVGFAWLDGERVVAELPYGGQAFGMVLVLPAHDETVDDLLSTLDDESWSDWMAALHLQDVTVKMPTFELEWDGLLNEALKAMGMPRAFDFRADFSRMTPDPRAYISEVRQKSYLRVDEEGSEAVASTSVRVSVLSSGPPSLTVDRPYLLAIRERISGTVLFIGVIRDPSLEASAAQPHPKGRTKPPWKNGPSTDPLLDVIVKRNGSGSRRS